MMKLSDLLKEAASLSKHGLSSYRNLHGEVRRGISMGVVKVDEAVPDWDTHAVMYGKPYVLYSTLEDPETWISATSDFIYYINEGP
jgi:hypothetical protein